MTRKGLDTNDRVLNFIEEYYIENLKFPNYREIADGVDLSSTSSVNRHMINLEKNNSIVFHGQQYRFSRERMIDIFKEIIESEGSDG